MATDLGRSELNHLVAPCRPRTPWWWIPCFEGAWISSENLGAWKTLRRRAAKHYGEGVKICENGSGLNKSPRHTMLFSTRIFTHPLFGYYL